MAEPNHVEIQEVLTEMVITEEVGSLSQKETEKLVRTILEHLRKQEDVSMQRQKDTEITNRVFPPHVR